jgi:hypothetical protein
MASRITGWGGGSKASVTSMPAIPEGSESEFDAGSQMNVPQIPRVTTMVVDEAVEGALYDMGLPPDTAEVFRNLISNDDLSGAATQFFHSKANERLDEVFGRVAKQEVVISYVMDDAATADLTKYAPEFKILFRNRANHDHPRAAASRVLDHQLILSRLPTGIPISDVGGNPLFHIRRGLSNVHICSPVIDRKDPGRHQLRKMEARKIMQDVNEDPRVSELAARYLERDPTLVCDQIAQQCHTKSTVITAVHVYDVPIQDWPKIMENKGASVVEGAVLFSPRFFEQREGVLEVAGARFEIIPEEDEFRMGFVDSPSWWYQHSWSSYMRYGVDQLIQSASGVYSYKVVERRGDTLFFRVLRVSGSAPPNFKQYYELPDVDVVEVKGFELTSGADRKALRSKTYEFPAPLWYDMVNHAALEYERGVLDFGKMYNYYRTIAPRQTINAVLVMGGFEVPMDQLIPLVVHSCLAAAASVMLSQRTTRHITNAEMDKRLKNTELTVVKVLSAIIDSAQAIAGVVLWPLSLIGELIKLGHKAIMSTKILSWQPICRLKKVNVIHMLKSTSIEHLRWYRRGGEPSSEDVYAAHAESRATLDQLIIASRDASMAGVLLDLCGEFMSKKHKTILETARKAAEEEPVEVEQVVSVRGPPSYRTKVTSESGHSAKLSADGAETRHRLRLLAIQEAIEEAEMENRKVLESCVNAFAIVSRRGIPVKEELVKHAEDLSSPDMWWVEGGVIVKSALGLPVGDFRHSAVYSPLVDASTGSHILSVHEKTWTGLNGDGDVVTRDYKLVGSRDYEGWVMTNDMLVIFNGPEVLRTMRAALEVRHDYDIVLQTGPPGCGKTHAIITKAKQGDCIMCPVRESISDTRSRLIQRIKGFTDARLRIRTVDSYLVNYFLNSKTETLRTDVLLADETFMTHAGKWYAVAGLLGISTMRAYGDPKQIPHIPRVQASKLHITLKPDSVEEVHITRRCPASAVAAWNHVYDNKVRTMSVVSDALREVTTHRGLDIPDGCVMMCMYQADKKVLREIYAQELKSGKVLIVTAHEAEGKTYKHVRLHRFDMRKRTDNFSLFDKQEHVLVAMSRHTHSFVYVRPADVGDLVSQWIVRSTSARRVAAAKEVSTAGQSKEFL